MNEHTAHNAVDEITVLELAALDAPPIIDVRETDEFVSGHVPGAVHIPLGELGERLAEIPAAAEIYLICASGIRSEHAAAALAARGIRAVNVVGGTNAWRRAGLDTVVGSAR